jgi:hypothetical protein
VRHEALMTPCEMKGLAAAHRSEQLKLRAGRTPGWG